MSPASTSTRNALRFRCTLWLRNTVYASVACCLMPWMVWRRIRSGRYRNGWREKMFGLRAADSPSVAPRPLIWLHGVSVGEVVLLRPLIECLRQHDPQTRFALSTTTDSGIHLARKSLPEDVPVFYFPWDFSWAVRQTLTTLQPSLIVLGELELWPNLISLAEQAGVPIAIANGRLSQRSHAGYRRFARWTRPMFESLALVAAQNQDYAERFRDCGAPEGAVVVTGSVKFDNASGDRSSPEVQQLRSLVGLTEQHQVLLAGSTQAPEEVACLQAYEALRHQYPQLKLIVVPRHPERFDEVWKQLRLSECRALRRSQLPPRISASDWDVLLVDTVGELKHWWGTAELALVGGSFGTRGGQNMLEPAAYGCSVAFGPKTSNFRDIVEQLLAAEAAVELDSLGQVRNWLRSELASPESRRQRGERAAKLVASGRGALQRTVEQLLPRIQRPAPSPVSASQSQRPSDCRDAA